MKKLTDKKRTLEPQLDFRLPDPVSRAPSAKQCVVPSVTLSLVLNAI